MKFILHQTLGRQRVSAGVGLVLKQGEQKSSAKSAHEKLIL